MRDARPSALAALAVYALLTIALTWPLARGLARDVPATARVLMEAFWPGALTVIV